MAYFGNISALLLLQLPFSEPFTVPSPSPLPVDMVQVCPPPPPGGLLFSVVVFANAKAVLPKDSIPIAATPLDLPPLPFPKAKAKPAILL